MAKKTADPAAFEPGSTNRRAVRNEPDTGGKTSEQPGGAPKPADEQPPKSGADTRKTAAKKRKK